MTSKDTATMVQEAQAENIRLRAEHERLLGKENARLRTERDALAARAERLRLIAALAVNVSRYITGPDPNHGTHWAVFPDGWDNAVWSLHDGDLADDLTVTVGEGT